MKKESFLCAVRGGHPIPLDSQRWDTWLGKHEGSIVYVTMAPNPKKHSDRQRAYYHAVVVAHVAEILESILQEPITHDDAHAWIKGRFLEPRRTRLGEIPPTTTTLSVDEMTEFIDKVIAFFRDHYGSHIPGPNELHEVAS